jgi:exonuclease III
MISQQDNRKKNNNKINVNMYKEKRTNKESINITTININGLNEEFKKQQLQHYYHQSNITIMGISDTKFKKTTNQKTMGDSKYKTFWANTEKQSGGVGLIVQRDWAKHIGKIIRWQGRILAIELIFKERRSIGIIQVYVPPQLNQERKEMIFEMRKILREWRRKQVMGIIVMGDMNTTTKDDRDRTGGKEPKDKKEWIKMLKDFELYDTYRQHNKNTKEYTWGNDTKSRIDMVWLSEDMKELCKGANITDIRQ